MRRQYDGFLWVISITALLFGVFAISWIHQNPHNDATPPGIQRQADHTEKVMQNNTDSLNMLIHMIREDRYLIQEGREQIKDLDRRKMDKQ